ncbi:hypothetical protein [Christiangramia sp. SM2212]|uniref:Beta-carotene 15,15'-monooxygenase n=1 Tax=Christiangramia sediminicola TaxID=3073267 RepID=A0ABU1ENY4_9FLAO|nr:hypothetical protein [Christiangramia sp. SM2212]MDR5589918.1 hypothetical protein [Christiangramia sp. SM2212]
MLEKSINRNLLIFGLPFTIFIAMIFLAGSEYFQNNPDLISIGITADILLTTPLLYSILIRKTQIPKTTIVPMIFIGLVLGYFILPSENQYYLNLFKSWALPVIELGVIGYIIYKVRSAINKFQETKTEHPDFFLALKNTCVELFPKRLVMPMAMEIGVFYYGFLNWKTRKLKMNEFTYHKQSGTMALLVTLIFLVIVETVVLHLLLNMWSSLAAWILSILSLYTAIQIFGFLRSMPKRPIQLTNSALFLNYGIMAETTIQLKDIAEIELSSKDLEKEDNTVKLSILGDLESHNMIIHLKNDEEIIGLYGTRKTYRNIALYVDDSSRLKQMIMDRVNF